MEMKIIKFVILLGVTFSFSAFAAPDYQRNLIMACGAVPRLYNMVTLAALQDGSDHKWSLSAYEVGNEILMKREEVDRMISYFKRNKDKAMEYLKYNNDNEDAEEGCMVEPRNYIPSYDRLVKQGVLHRDE